MRVSVPAGHSHRIHIGGLVNRSGPPVPGPVEPGRRPGPPRAPAPPSRCSGPVASGTDLARPPGGSSPGRSATDRYPWSRTHTWHPRPAWPGA